MSKKKDVMPNNNNNVLFIVIIVLLVIIAILAFFVGKNTGTTVVSNNGAVVATDLKITVIDDTRCTSCGTDDIVNQLKTTPFLATAEYELKDFADEGIEDYIRDNNITALPAVVFSTNQIADNGAMTQFLSPISTGEFSLQIGSTFDPFAKRSDKGFLQLDIADVEAIQKTAYATGDENAKILWVEYSDITCHFCKRMASDGTVSTVEEALPSTFKHAFVNFIGTGGATAQSAAEVLECIASTGSEEAYNYAFEQSLINEKTSANDIIAYAEEKGTDKAGVAACIESGDSKSIVASKFSNGQTTFGITGTPGNVLINTETGEYEIVSGAYPAATFQTTIESLLN